jgi:predicted nucleotidyltransferase
MRQKLNEAYRKAAVEFARRVTSALGDQVDSIVLYGSVARGEAKRDSDIDILVVRPDLQRAREKLSEIRSDFSYEQNYTFFISLVHYSREELYKLTQIGSPFIQNIVREGVILYDNGTFSPVCEKGIAASR